MQVVKLLWTESKLEYGMNGFQNISKLHYYVDAVDGNLYHGYTFLLPNIMSTVIIKGSPVLYFLQLQIDRKNFFMQKPGTQ